MSAVSPELALVDPDLAARLRSTLPDPGCFVPASLPSLRPPRRVAPVPAPAPRRAAPRRRLTRVAASAVAAAALGSLLLLGRPHETGTSGPEASAAAQGASRAAAERASRRYGWSRLPGVEEYAVTLLRGREVVHRAIARETAFTVPRGLRLAPGRYTWVVEASGSARQTPLLESTFVVQG
jgi:hypothetical protein